MMVHCAVVMPMFSNNMVSITARYGEFYGQLP